MEQDGSGWTVILLRGAGRPARRIALSRVALLVAAGVCVVALVVGFFVGWALRDPGPPRAAAAGVDEGNPVDPGAAVDPRAAAAEPPPTEAPIAVKVQAAAPIAIGATESAARENPAAEEPPKATTPVRVDPSALPDELPARKRHRPVTTAPEAAEETPRKTPNRGASPAEEEPSGASKASPERGPPTTKDPEDLPSTTE